MYKVGDTVCILPKKVFYDKFGCYPDTHPDFGSLLPGATVPIGWVDSMDAFLGKCGVITDIRKRSKGYKISNEYIWPASAFVPKELNIMIFNQILERN